MPGSDVCEDACLVDAADASGSKIDLRTKESLVVRPGILFVAGDEF